MLVMQDFDRKYGVATTLPFVVPSPSASSSDKFYTSGAVWDGAGESKISKDGGSFNDTTNDPTSVGSGLFALQLTAAEMQCNEAIILLTDTGNAVRDIALRIRTHLQLGSADIDAATGAKANTTALKLAGYGSGHGLQAIRGATGNDIEGIVSRNFIRTGITQSGSGSTVRLDAGANSTDSYYNGAIFMTVRGTGAGQARIITAYDGTNKDCTLDTALLSALDANTDYVIFGGPRVWETTLPELTALPSAGDTAGKKLQLLFQRFAFKIDQSATVQQWYNSTNGLLFTRSVDDDGNTQTIAKLT